MTERTYFGCIDLRNAKYQGSITNNSMDGIGIVFDNEFMLTLSNWKNEVPYGPTLIIFPNRDYLYGHFRNKRLHDICCYVTSNGQVYFLNFVDGMPSQSIAYIDNNSTIIEIDNSGQAKSIKSYIKQRQTEDKWRVISNILRGDVSQDYQNYKTFINAFLLKDNPAIECSENSGLTFIGFKDTVSLGVKLDKRLQIRQIGNFQEFPRNLEYGRIYIQTPNGETKVQEGKFVEPQQVYVYKSDKRGIESMKLTENYFKKGTNFKNQFLKLNIFIELSKYFSDMKHMAHNLKSLEFGQRILQNQSVEGVANQGDAIPLTKRQLQDAKRDIYSAASKKGRVTSRSPLRNQIIEPFASEYEYRESSRKNSNQKYQYKNRQVNEFSPLKPVKRSKDKYRYTKELMESETGEGVGRKNTEYALRYREIIPEVSDFDRNLDRNYRNPLPDPAFEALLRQRIINARMQELKRQEQLMRNHEITKHLALTPIDFLHTPNRNRSVSPIKVADQYRVPQPRIPRNIQQQPPQSKYKNYLDYKNRNRVQNDKSREKPSPDKQLNDKKGHERAPQKDIALLDRPRNILPEQLGVDPNRNNDKNLPGRYKKTFKYLNE